VRLRTPTLVICGSPDSEPEQLLLFTPAWQSGAKFSGVWESRMVRKDGNGPNEHSLFHTFFRKIVRLATI
jgi:hypothetical protein